MPISHTAKVAVNEPSEEIDLGNWIFGLSDEGYQACIGRKLHRPAAPA